MLAESRLLDIHMLYFCFGKKAWEAIALWRREEKNDFIQTPDIQ